MKSQKRRTHLSFAVVCEGQSEWYYFNFMKGIKRYPFRLKPTIPSSANYMTIFKKAKELLKTEGYNAIFCVFDLDKVKTDGKIENLIAECRRNRNKKIIPIFSFPCIEVWFLFHFLEHYSSRYYESCEEIMKALKVFVPGYSKERVFLANPSFFASMNRDDRKNLAFENGKASIKELSDLHEAFYQTFTEVGSFEQFLEKCQKCNSLAQDCDKCIEEFGSSVLSGKR